MTDTENTIWEQVRLLEQLVLLDKRKMATWAPDSEWITVHSIRPTRGKQLINVASIAFVSTYKSDSAVGVQAGFVSGETVRLTETALFRPAEADDALELQWDIATRREELLVGVLRPWLDGEDVEGTE